jgi:RNA polymerase sigma-70 factor (ECF subfamily)
LDQPSRTQLNRDLASLAQGDRSALEPVYRALWPVLSGWAKRLLPADAAEDVAQEALLKLFFRASDYDPTRDALSWALGILSYQVLTERKRAQRAGRHATVPPESAAESHFDGDAALAELLPQLSPLDEATLRAAFGLPGGAPTVAGATYRKRLQRALERARRTWRLVNGRS